MTLSSILVPSSGCLLGVYPSTSCDSATSYATRVRNHEALIGRSATTGGVLGIVSSYHDWNDYATAFPTADEQALSDEGRLLLIHWTPRIFNSSTQYKWADIANGVYDNSIVIPQAKLMRDFGRTFFLAFHNEMNASSTDGGGTYGSDTDYAAAAQHLHNVFAAQGATNVVWVFKPSGYTTQFPTRMNNLYPGDSYVDWIGWDPYGSASTGDTVDYVLSTKYPMVNWATVTKSGSHTKPMMMAEWGKKEVSGSAGAKAQFFADIQTVLKGPPYNIIKAAVYFNGVSGVSECLNTSTTTLNGYKALAADQFFNPDVSPTGPPVGTGAFRAGASKAYSNSASQTLIYPAAAQAGDGALLIHTCTRTGLKNAAEGTNLANVTTGNSNSVGSNPWDSVGSPIPVYSSTQAHTGTTSIHYSLAAQTTARTSWELSFGSPSTYYGRLYYYRTALPPQITRLMQQNPASGSTPSTHWGIGLDTAGHVIVRDVAGASTKWTSSTVPAANQWNRVEWKAAWNGSTTTVNVRIYSGANVDTLTLAETEGVSTAITQAAAGTSYNFGLASPSQTYDIYLDDMGLDANAWMGPVGTSAVLTDPTGWTPVDSRLLAAGAGELTSRAYRRTTAAGDPGSTITLNTDVNAHGAILLVAYSGVDQLALVDVEASSTSSTDSTTIATPVVTTTGNNEWIVSAAFTRDNPGGATTAWTLPGGQGQRAAAFPSGTTDGRVAGVASDDGTAHAAGATTAQTFTTDRTGYLKIGWTVAVKSTAAVSSGQSFGFMAMHN